VPDVTDRNADPQLATASLGASRIQHARPDDAEFKLADAALHAKKQSVVGTAGVVHAVQIDDAGADQSAEFQKVVPVAAIAGKPGSVEAEHGPDFAGAKPCHELVETWPGHHAAGGAAEIIIDDLDIPKSSPPRFLDQVILPALALEIVLNLGLT
jgi:hypothetical protein